MTNQVANALSFNRQLIANILAIFLSVLISLPVSAIGEIQTITHTVKQPFGGSQSPDDARISAVAKAKREALEKAGTYIESITVVKNLQVDKDEILALSAGVLKAEVVSQKNYASDDAFGIDIVVKVVVDTSVLEERIKKLLKDKPLLEQLKQAREREKELMVKIAGLEKEDRKPGKSKQKAANLKKEFKAASQGLTAVDWLQKAVALGADKNYIKALEYINEAIRLKPDFYVAYYARGMSYRLLKQPQQAISDLDKAIRMNPNYAEAYSERGVSNVMLKQYQQAISDFDAVVRLNPDYAIAYLHRGFVYNVLKQYQRAISDFDKAIRLNPDEPWDYLAYSGRGHSYLVLEQNQQAISDFDKAIRLKPDHDEAIAETYLLRGRAYRDLGQYQRAISDLYQAIRLKADYAEAYQDLGFCYVFFLYNNEGCFPISKACELGALNSCEILKKLKLEGVCKEMTGGEINDHHINEMRLMEEQKRLIEQKRQDNLQKNNTPVAEDRFVSYMDNYVPDWRQIDRDPDFIKWLQKPLPFTKNTNFLLLRAAVKEQDGPRAAQFFIDYKNYKQASKFIESLF